MSLRDLDGARFGPVSTTTTAAKVDEYVTATGDDPERWSKHAPPGYAAALLFIMAPRLLGAPEVEPYTRVLVHSDQRLVWRGPFRIGDELTIEASVSRIRARGAMYFVSFDTVAASAGATVVESESTFLLSDDPGAQAVPVRAEPPVRESGRNETAGRYAPVPTNSPLPAMAKSASRADLVRYAGASGDFNPVHYDHATAREAGFGGVVVHGLLMAAWSAQLAAGAGADPAPLAEMRLRFRNPLYAGAQATVSGEVLNRNGGLAEVSLRVMAEENELVTGRAKVQEG